MNTIFQLLGKKIFSKRTLAIIALIFTAFSYSLLSLNSRILAQGFQPMTQVYVRVGFGLLLAILFFRKKISLKRIKKTSLNDWFWLTMMGTLGYSVTVWFGTLASLNTKLVNASVISATAPFIVYIYSYFLLKEKIKLKLIVVLFVALYGISIIASHSLLPQLEGFGLGEIFALASVAAMGFWSVGIKKLSSYLKIEEISVIVMAIAALTGFLIAQIRGETLDLNSFLIPNIWLGIAIGAGLNFALTFLENFAFKNIEVVFGNQLLMLSTLFSMINGYLFYQEFITRAEFIGAILIVVSVLFANNILKKT